MAQIADTKKDSRKELRRNFGERWVVVVVVSEARPGRKMLSVRVDQARGITPLFGGHEKGLGVAILVRHGSQELMTPRLPYDAKAVDFRSTLEIWDGEVVAEKRGLWQLACC